MLTGNHQHTRVQTLRWDQRHATDTVDAREAHVSEQGARSPPKTRRNG